MKNLLKKRHVFLSALIILLFSFSPVAGQVLGIDKTDRLVYCDACGKCMTDKDSIATFIGIEINIYTQLSGSVDTKNWNEFIDQQLGQYSGRRQFRVCYECWLKSLGIKVGNKTNMMGEGKKSE